MDSVADVKSALNKAEDQTKKAVRGRPVLDITSEDGRQAFKRRWEEALRQRQYMSAEKSDKQKKRY